MMKKKNLVAVMLAAWGVSGCFEQDTKQDEDKKRKEDYSMTFNQIAFDVAKSKYERGDYFGAYENMSISAENGYVAAQLETAQMLLEGKGVRRNESAAVDWLKKAAEQKDAEALFKLGKYYQEGTITALGQDYHQALQLFSQAAEQKHDKAQFELGVQYENGWGVRVDKAKAKEWFGKACDNGSQAGCDKYKTLTESEK